MKLLKSILNRPRVQKSRLTNTPRRLKPVLESLEERILLSFVLKLDSSGGTVLTIPDNECDATLVGTCDSNPTLGLIGVSTPIDSFTLSINAAQSKPIIGSSDKAELFIASTDLTSSTGGTLVVSITDTDYAFTSGSGTASMESVIGGVTPGSVDFQSFVSTDNTEFDTTGPNVFTAGARGPFSGGYTDTTVIDHPYDGQFSMTAVAVVVLPAGSSQSFSVSLVSEPKPALGDYVFEDLNADGIQNDGNTGINGVPVNLYIDTDGDGVQEPGGDDGAPVASTVTANDSSGDPGYYLFDQLTAVVPYFVEFVTPSGSTISPQFVDDLTANPTENDSNADPTTGLSDIVTLGAAEVNLTIDAGIYDLASLGDFVWHDQNGNGIQDGTEPGIPGATVKLIDGDDGTTVLATTTTNASGGYSFTGLEPGNYQVMFVTPAGFTESSPVDVGSDALDSDGAMTPVVTLASGENNPTLDSGFYNLASLGDFVWHDQNGNGIQDGTEPGIPGATVKLIDGDDGTTVLATTTTNASGGYSFTGLEPGNYQVMFGTPAGFTESSPVDVGSDALDSDGAMTPVVTLASGENNPTLDSGFYNLASLGDFVWHDENANGVQDGTEPGIPGATVKLIDGDDGTTVLATTTTNASGGYSFTGLEPGNYQVMFVTPAGFTESSPVDVGSDALDSDGAMTPVVTLASGENNPTLDSGFYNLASLGDFVWHDQNGNGIQDGTEPGIPGATVKLIDGDDGTTVLATTTTNASGGYSFTGLEPGNYQVMFGTPAGFTESSPVDVGSDALDSDGAMTPVVTLASGENNPTLDSGFYNLASLGDFVWHDENANGVQDGTEPGIPGATVKLIDGDDGTTVLATATTNASGGYSFTGLEPGNYQVMFGTPAGFTESSPVDVGSDALDSDGAMTPVVTLASGENNPTLDSGFYNLASLGDFVWHDQNGNGIQDGTEPGIPGATVKLIDGDDGTTVLATTTTNASGGYSFTGLEPGNYQVMFVTPAGFTESSPVDVGSDALDSDGAMTPVVTLASGENNPTLDSGFYNLASLGDFVWHDENANGVQDGTEPGIPGATVKLIDGDDGTTVLATTTTNASGGYSFTGLEPGNYQVMFVQPSGFSESSPVDAGGDDTKDSDGLMTPVVILASGEDNPTLDSGFYQANPDIDIEKATNGVDADTEAEAPEISPGSPVTWTYEVTNTGSVPYGVDDINVVDDAGTPGDTGDDFSPTLVSSSDAGSDGILSPGETWIFEASDVAQDLTTPGATSSFVMTGSSSTDGPDGNIRTFTSGGISVNTSAFSRESNGTWAEAYLGLFSSGLGVTDSGEGNGSNGLHRVDNVTRLNYVLFEFSETVIVDRAFLDSVVNDSDLSVWIGTVPDAFTSHVTLSDSVLSGLGLTEVNNTSSSSSRWADFNSGDVAGNVLVLAASVEDPTPEDRFKIRKIEVQEPASGCYGNLSVVTTGPNGPTDSDPSHYCNPTENPGIDIEKFTNGVNADTVGEAPQIAPGANVTWTYTVKNTGNVSYTLAQIDLVDDAGTPGDTGDDFLPSLSSSNVDVGNDGILSPGETWLFEASDVAADLTTPGASSTFDFSGSGSLDGPDGNIRSFSMGGTSVDVSAFSRDANGTWADAYLGQFSSGLGVTDSSEGDGGNGLHRVDNVGRLNYVLFEFSETVIVDATFLDSVVNDSDLSVWIGTLGGGHTSLNDSVLASLELNETNNTGSGSSRWADVNSGGVAGNVLVLAASVVDATPEDRFKIHKVTVQQTTNGCYENIAVVTAGGATDTDLSHYCNPDGDLGIDIEKLTNGEDADNSQGSDVPEIDPGDTVTWTYLVTNTGDIPLDFNDVVVVDDNGTPGDANDDFTPNFVSGSDVGSDLVLAPGETWEYTFGDVAQDLQVVIDFDGFDAGTIINEQYHVNGLTITTHDPVNHPAMIFDSSNPTGGDQDLATPGSGANNDNALEKILIISEDADSSDPDDNAAGGTLIFDFDEPVRINMVDILDVEETGGTVKTFDANGDVISTHTIEDLGDNSLQSIGIGDEGVTRMEIALAGSGAVTELSFDRIYGNVATASVGALSDSDPSHYRNPATPVDSDPAYKRFFVVDTYVDKTFEYDSDGTPLENSHLAGSNYAPRGITMTQDGKTNWVIDKYNGVFVYNDAGVLLGTWDAGGLTKPEGIATDETNIWVVDRYTDKVYFYDASASRLSGAQNPDSSFPLASGNSNPRGITSDGETIWVVNDGRYHDAVYVYDTNGNHQGTWKLSHNVKPRGITINPGDVKDLWIVDAYYDKVHEYQGAVHFTSGTRSPDFKWHLTSGNSKPEGIADPPPPEDGIAVQELDFIMENEQVARDADVQTPEVFLPDWSVGLPSEGAVELDESFLVDSVARREQLSSIVEISVSRMEEPVDSQQIVDEILATGSDPESHAELDQPLQATDLILAARDHGFASLDTDDEEDLWEDLF